MKTMAALLVLSIAGAGGAQVTQTIPPPHTNGVTFPYQYAAKIICGRPVATPVYPKYAASGTYFSEVNLHNPSRTKGVVIRKKFINAQPDERPTKPTVFFHLELSPDWGTQIDCPNIWKHLGLAPGAFVEGFVIVESSLEVDVVGLYTAEGPNGLISTMEIDRVPGRKMP